MDTLSRLVDAALAIEKLRVASQVRQTHLRLQGRTDPETDELLKRQIDLEDYTIGRIAFYITGHPAYCWFSLVKGVGRENIAKVVGMVRVAPEYDDKSKELPYADTISALWNFAGFSVDNGKAPKRQQGEKLHYNSQLRSMCWRLENSLILAGGKFYDYYATEKQKYTTRFIEEGKKILPTPSGKYACANCGMSFERKQDITQCCNSPMIEKKIREEPKGVIWQGHLDNMARRKMIKLFLACLWLVWREELGLPVTKPYPIAVQGHSSFINPWEMTDRANVKEKTNKGERAIDNEETKSYERATRNK